MIHHYTLIQGVHNFDLLTLLHFKAYLICTATAGERLSVTEGTLEYLRAHDFTRFYEKVSYRQLGAVEKMADNSPETSTAPSEEASKTRPANVTSTSLDTTQREEQAKKASSGLMDPPVSF